jgi:hypothetical protein
VLWRLLVWGSVVTGTVSASYSGTSPRGALPSFPSFLAHSAPGTSLSSQLVANPDFEAGQAPWQVASAPIHQIISTKMAHSGSYSAVMCGASACNDRISQMITVPVSFSRITLSFWYSVPPVAHLTTCGGTVTSRLLTPAGRLIAVLSSACAVAATNGWVQRFIDVTSRLNPYRGQQVVLSFQANTGTSDPARYGVDDVGLTVISSSQAASPTATRTPVPTATAVTTATSTSTSTPTASPTAADTPTTTPFPGNAYYLSPTGVDAGPCSAASPCATLYYVTTAVCHAGWSVQPGDTVLVLNGTYTTTSGVSMCGTTVDNPLGYVKGTNGTASDPVTIQGQPGAQFQRVNPAPDASQNLPLVDISGSSYVSFEGIRVLGMKGRSDYNPADTTTLYGEVNVSGTGGAGIVLRNLSISHSNFTCVKQEDDESFETIANNTIADCGSPGNTLEHGIYLSGGHNIVVNNTVTGTSGYGIHSYQTSGVAVDNETIVGNTVSGACSGSCADIYMYEGPSTISGNVVSGAYIGIEAWASGGVVTIRQNVVKGNVIAGISLHAGVDSGYEVVNNTFYRNGFEEIGQSGAGTITATLENNIFSGAGDYLFNPGGTWSSSSVLDFNDYQDVTGSSLMGAHSIRLDPLFVNAGAGDFHLQPGSPAAGTGTSVYGPPAPDIGAF